MLDSFENLLETLKTEDEIGKVIRTHIHFENAINHFLFIALEKPQNLKNVKLDYYGKINLAACLGLPEDIIKPLISIGKIRNSFAHNLDNKIDTDKINNFFNSFSNKSKEEMIQNCINKNPPWFPEAKSWKDIAMAERFFVMCFSLFSEIRSAITVLEFNKKELQLKIEHADLKAKFNQ